MTTNHLLDFGAIEAHFVGGPADGTTAITYADSTGFPPSHVSIQDDDGATRHLYGVDTSWTVFRYLGPLAS
jgi:hypothetical protein